MLQVREMILRKLDASSLVNCRLVCHSWNLTASSVLQKMPVWIKRDWSSDRWLRLYECMGKSQNFPCTALNLSLTSLSRCGRINNQNADKLFTAFGGHFTHLRLNNSYEEYPEMVINLLKKTPNLRFLEVSKLPEYVEDEGSEEFSMPSLRVLSVREGEGDGRSLTKLILSAPQLVEIQNVNSSSAIQMEAIRVTGKMSLVSSLTLSADPEVPISSELTSNPPRLTALSVESKDSSRQFVTAVKVVLAESQRTLKKLEFLSFAVQLDEAPVLPNLQELGFKISQKELKRGSPRAAVLPELSNNLFPKLKKIRLEVTGLDATDYEIQQSDIENLFWKECEEPMESLEMLELEIYCSPDTIKYLATIFPRVTFVSVNYSKFRYGSSSYRPTSHIWCLEEFPRLSKLFIRNLPYKNGFLDTALTGMPTEIIDKLEIAPKKTIPSDWNKILRPNGSILQLKSN